MSDVVNRKESAKDFHLQEWQALHVEINNNALEMRDTERNVVIACIAIWVWVLAQKTFFYSPALILPTIATILGNLRVEALSRADTDIGAYLRKIEKEYGFSPSLGWEVHFRGPSEDLETQHRVGASRRAFWRVMVVVSTVISLLVAVYLWYSSVPS